ncbi:MAG: DUF3501 family protein [Acidithiobacillales bacterium]
MRKIELSDVKNLHEYELIRHDWRKNVIAEKDRRRVLLGPSMSLVFENRLTVLAQIQEMCRAERIVRPEAVQQEIDVYNELLPDAGEVAATLLVEITEEERIQPELDRLIGLTSGRYLFMDVGGRRVDARFLEGQSRSDRIAAVQYVRFPLGGDIAAREALSDPRIPVSLRIDHPNYRASAGLSIETRRELARDLAAD